MIKNRVYYKVGEQKLIKQYLSFVESQRSGKPVEFDLFTESFDRVGWKDPVESWDQLLDRRAQQIAEKNKPIVLAFSGGTDSYTAYQVFRRNNIPLYAVHFLTKDYAEETTMFSESLSFIQQEQKEHGFKLVLTKETSDSLTRFYDSPDWVFSDTPVRIEFGVMAEHTFLEKNHFMQSHDLVQDYVYVTGHEKPYIQYRDGRFYSYVRDKHFHNYTDPRIDYFFISPELPELHVKQSYLLARYMKYLADRSGRSPALFERIQDPALFNYLDYAVYGCGRFGDLADSRTQKLLIRKFMVIVPDGNITKTVYQGRSPKMFEEGLRHNLPYVTNYLKGLMALKSDPAFRGLFENEHIHPKEIDSKHYLLEDL